MPAKDDKPEQPQIITVGKLNDDGRAVWDRHPFHPSNYGQPAGEVFIADMRPYQVHRTRGIRQKMNENEITELSERDAKSRLGEFEEAEEQRQAQREQARQAREQAGPVGGGNSVTVPPPADPQPPLTGHEGGDVHPNTAVENDPGGVGDPNDDGDTEEQRRVRRPRPPGDKPER
jgi:hypothetical protein